MTTKKFQRARVIGCIPLTRASAGFAVPALVHPSDSELLAVQEIDEVSGRVSGFRALERERQESQVIHVDQGKSIGIGEEQYYAFVVGDNVSIGTLAMLRLTLEQFAKENSSQDPLIFQIRELIGSDQERKTARTGMRKFLLDAQGRSAARSFYEGSVLQSVLWARLLQACTDKSMAQRILAARAKISASISDSGALQLNLSALTKEDRAAIDEKSILSAILSEFDPAPAESSNLLDGDPELGQQEIQTKAANLVQRINQTGRQEERVALLLSAILSDPLVGKSALLQYQTDRAKMAAWALKELRKTFIDTNWPSNEHVVAALIPKLFTQQWPMTRGDLLFFLAKHLAKWPKVNASIRGSLRHTHSVYVQPWRKEIEEALGQSHATQAKPG